MWFEYILWVLLYFKWRSYISNYYKNVYVYFKLLTINKKKWKNIKNYKGSVMYIGMCKYWCVCMCNSENMVNVYVNSTALDWKKWSVISFIWGTIFPYHSSTGHTSFLFSFILYLLNWTNILKFEHTYCWNQMKKNQFVLKHKCQQFYQGHMPCDV